MHGRLKVKTSAQLEAENLAKKEQKLKYFHNVVKEIFELRAILKANFQYADNGGGEGHNEMSENDNIMDEIMIPLLKKTAEVLTNNPDISTFWNIRREILLRIKESCTGYV